MISIICVSNQLNVAHEVLLHGLEKQSQNFEWILIDNSTNQYPSAASALNAGARKAKGDTLIFAHQDLSIEQDDFLDQIDSFLKNHPQSVVGIAGSKVKHSVITNITQGPNKTNAGELQIDVPTPVQTLDEVLMACKSDVFKSIYFDEKVCNDWHLYAVDFCLSAKSLGIDSYVLPLYAHHLSSGKLSLGYALTLFKVMKKHRKQFEFIHTTCGSSKTSLYRRYQYTWGLIRDHVINKGYHE